MDGTNNENSQKRERDAIARPGSRKRDYAAAWLPRGWSRGISLPGSREYSLHPLSSGTITKMLHPGAAMPLCLPFGAGGSARESSTLCCPVVSKSRNSFASRATEKLDCISRMMMIVSITVINDVTRGAEERGQCFSTIGARSRPALAINAFSLL